MPRWLLGVSGALYLGFFVAYGQQALAFGDGVIGFIGGIANFLTFGAFHQVLPVPVFVIVALFGLVPWVILLVTVFARLSVTGAVALAAVIVVLVGAGLLS